MSQTVNQSVRENDRPEKGDEDRNRGQHEMMSGRFTAVEGVPGVWLQHIRSVLRDASSLQTLRRRLLWETDVTGQGLRDVVDAVHLQVRLVWNTETGNLMMNKFGVRWSTVLHIVCLAVIMNA